MVQDTAWEGYEEIPTWIMQGYGTLALEADQQAGMDAVQPISLSRLASDPLQARSSDILPTALKRILPSWSSWKPWLPTASTALPSRATEADRCHRGYADYRGPASSAGSQHRILGYPEKSCGRVRILPGLGKRQRHTHLWGASSRRPQSLLRRIRLVTMGLVAARRPSPSIES